MKTQIKYIKQYNGLLDLYNKEKAKNTEIKYELEKIVKKHEEARDIAGEQLTTTQIVADSNSLNYGRIQAHNVVIKDLQELLEE